MGGGSAGFLAAITLKHRLPQLDVTVLRSREIGIIGVGEATTIVLPRHLHHYLGLDAGEFFRLAEPQWKLGIRFLWGKRPWFDYAFGYQLDRQFHLLPKATGYYCAEGPFDYVGICSGLMTLNNAFVREQDGRPLMGQDLGYHIENVKFVGYLETVAARLGVTVREDTVVDIRQGEHGIRELQLASGQTIDADLFVDCSGFVSALLGKTLKEPFQSFASSLYCDQAVVGSWDRTDEPIKPYTTAETMDAGWCWQIDHEHHINRGYVHSSAYMSAADAEAELRAKNPRIGPTRLVKYVSGRYERSWVKNVCAIGNSSGFVEPLESTGLSAICLQFQALGRDAVPRLPTANRGRRRSASTTRGSLATGTRSGNSWRFTTSSTSGSIPRSGGRAGRMPTSSGRRRSSIITARTARASHTERRCCRRATSSAWRDTFRCWSASKCRIGTTTYRTRRPGGTGSGFGRR